MSNANSRFFATLNCACAVSQSGRVGFEMSREATDNMNTAEPPFTTAENEEQDLHLSIEEVSRVT